MVKLDFNNIAITGISCCVPDNVETLEKYNDIFDKETVDKFSVMSGVCLRHICLSKQTASDLAFTAADKLINSKHIDKESIGILAFISQTPDYRLPATACVLQHRLSLSKDCICFDINLGCSAYVYGLSVVSSIMANSNIDTGLLLTGDTISKLTSPKDRSISMLLADAASATLLQKSKNATLMSMAYQSDGNKFRSVIVPAGGFRNCDVGNRPFPDEDGNIRSYYDLCMNGTDIFSFGMTDVPKFVKSFINQINKSPENFDALIMHQANLYLMKHVAKKIGFDMSNVPVSIDKFGNTSGSCIPVTIVDTYASRTGQDRTVSLLLCGFGVGLSQGTADIAINTKDVLPMIYSNAYFNDGVISHD